MGHCNNINNDLIIYNNKSYYVSDNINITIAGQ